MPDGTVEIRCSCRGEPLLAVGGRDDDGNGFVHVKTWKGKRLYMEVIITEGTAHIHCRNCFRWMRIRIVHKTVEQDFQRLPETIHV